MPPCVADEVDLPMNRRGLLIRLAGLGAAVAGGVWLRDQVVWRRPEVSVRDSEWTPWAHPRVDVPTIWAVIAGRRVRALIDSGAEYSAIDRGFVESLGLKSSFNMPLVAYGVGGQPQLGRGVTLNLEAGGLAIARLQAAILDLGPVASAAGLETPLILGQDVLGEAMLDLDLSSPRRSARRLRFLPPGSPAEEGLSAVSARRVGRGLKSEVVVEGGVIEALVDTGSSSALALSEGEAGAAGLNDGRPSDVSSTLVLGGAMSSRNVRVASLSAAGADLGRSEVSIFATPRLPGFPGALLGTGAFRGRRVVLDVGGGRIFTSRALDLTVG